MKPVIKKFMLSTVLHGSVFGFVMWGLDSFEGKSFDILKFILRFLFFGIFMAATDYFIAKRRDAKKSAEENQESH